MSRVTYQEAETYISELPKFTKKNTLEHTQKFLSFLGNPQNGKKVIRVSGCDASGTGKAHRAFHISASDSDE